jgi:hypothetical protein
VDREKEEEKVEGEKIEGFKIYSTKVFPLFLRGYERSFSMNQWFLRALINRFHFFWFMTF